jgi:mannose-6-phosphate isomerase-like protein (cupin superfamily)
MKKVNEDEFQYRNGDSGPKYLMRGPNIDWGVMLVKPGKKMGKHGHAKTEETFYFLKGTGNMIVNDKAHPAKAGDVFLIEPREYHDVENTGSEDMKVLFMKYPYLLEDKI